MYYVNKNNQLDTKRELHLSRHVFDLGSFTTVMQSNSSLFSHNPLTLKELMRDLISASHRTIESYACTSEIKSICFYSDTLNVYLIELIPFSKAIQKCFENGSFIVRNLYFAHLDSV